MQLSGITYQLQKKKENSNLGSEKNYSQMWEETPKINSVNYIKFKPICMTHLFCKYCDFHSEEGPSLKKAYY
jgi:hypothetical protein